MCLAKPMLPGEWHRALLAAARGDADTLGGWRRVRDLSVFAIAPDVMLVIACDSIGGIGPKMHDSVSTTGEEVGRFAARVVLLEIIACGATPILLIDTLSVEREPTGAAIIAGIHEEMRAAGLDPARCLNGSTEENVPTVATGVGVVALGLATTERFRPGRARAGDLLICIGIPKSAPHHSVVSDDPHILHPVALQRLVALDTVGDILIVGSRGIAAEAHDLAAYAGLHFVPEPAPAVDLIASGGPGTCCIAAVSSTALPVVRALPDLPPINVIGTLVENDSNAEDAESAENTERNDRMD